MKFAFVSHVHRGPSSWRSTWARFEEKQRSAATFFDQRPRPEQNERQALGFKHFSLLPSCHFGDVLELGAGPSDPRGKSRSTSPSAISTQVTFRVVRVESEAFSMTPELASTP